MCMLVSRAPQSSLASFSLRELDVVYEVFQKSAPNSKPAAVLLVSISPVFPGAIHTLRPGPGDKSLEEGPRRCRSSAL